MKKLIGVIATSIILMYTTNAIAESYEIGVLAKRGRAKTLEQWKATADYLTQTIPGDSFTIRPVDYTEVDPGIESQEIDFLLVNSSMFVSAQVKHGVVPIATMINSRQGQPLKSFGSVVFVSAENEQINSLSDLKGKTFAGVKESSFGGWQMAYKAMLEEGVDPLKDCKKVDFSGKHDNVVYAVINGEADAGTVRTDTLERMAKEGVIDLEDVRIINQQQHEGFPFLISSPLYPEWPLAKVAHVSDTTADKVAQALIKLDSSNQAAKSSKVYGWTASLDYEQVRKLLETLKIGAYKL